MAPFSRSLRDLGQRDHAAADASADGDPVLGALDGAVSNGDRARDGAARRRASRLGRARILLARAQSLDRRTRGAGAMGRCTSRRGERASEGSRHRPVHRRSDRVDRVRRASPARRRQRGAGSVSRLRASARHQIDCRRARALDPCGSADGGVAENARTRRAQPGADGAGSVDLQPAVAALPPVSRRDALQGRT